MRCWKKLTYSVPKTYLLRAQRRRLRAGLILSCWLAFLGEREEDLKGGRGECTVEEIAEAEKHHCGTEIEEGMGNSLGGVPGCFCEWRIR